MPSLEEENIKNVLFHKSKGTLAYKNYIIPLEKMKSLEPEIMFQMTEGRPVSTLNQLLFFDHRL